jgi:Tfp pilus assembly protein PilF
LRIAGKLIQENNFEGGIPALQKAIEYSEKYNDQSTKSKAEGQLSKVYLAYAKNLLKNEKYEEANEYFNKIIAIDPNNATVYLFKAVMNKQQGKTDLFKENLLKCIELAKNSNDRKTEKTAIDQGSKFYLKNALDAFSGNKFEECIANLNISLEFDPNQPDALFYLLLSYNKLSKWDDAISAGKKALSLETGGAEKKAPIHFEMANAFKEKGDNTQACENYKNAMYGQYLENAKYQIEHILKCTN